MGEVARVVAVINHEVPLTDLGSIVAALETIYGKGLNIRQGRWTRFEVLTPGDLCWCHECEDRDSAVVCGITGDMLATIQRGMILCPECGNKRCPRATSHDEDCTGSNEPGQVGSVYGISRADAFFAEVLAKRASVVKPRPTPTTDAPEPHPGDERAAGGECHASAGARAECERMADEAPDVRCPCGRAPGRPTPTTDAPEETTK